MSGNFLVQTRSSSSQFVQSPSEFQIHIYMEQLVSIFRQNLKCTYRPFLFLHDLSNGEVKELVQKQI